MGTTITAQQKINKLASRLAKAEGGKSQAKIGDIRQLLKLLAKEVIREPQVLLDLVEYIEALMEKESSNDKNSKTKRTKKGKVGQGN